MLKEIEDFYRSTKIERLAAIGEGEVPLAHVKIFHKQYPRLPNIVLPEATMSGELAELLRSRKSSRNFSTEPVTLEELAAILSSCAIVDTSGPFERRTYPSAGARFPVEMYVVNFSVAGLAPGCYHYDIEGRRLDVLWETDLRSRESEIVSPAVENPSASLVFTAVIARAEVKYGARAYPFALLEAGHMAQNVSLVGTRMGIGLCAIGGFVNDTIAQCLDLTKDEIPIYGMALGKEA